MGWRVILVVISTIEDDPSIFGWTIGLFFAGVPVQNPQGTQCVPSAGSTWRAFHHEADLIEVGILKRPATILVLFLRHQGNGFIDSFIRFDAGSFANSPGLAEHRNARWEDRRNAASCDRSLRQWTACGTNGVPVDIPVP